MPALISPVGLNHSDVTGTVNMTDPVAVADTICAILGRRYPGFNEAFLRKGFSDIVDAFWGRYPGLLQCDTPYHDLRHSLGTALLMARLVDGYEETHAAGTPALGREEGTLAVILALYHDIGFLRRDSESDINGAFLVHDHEQRGVDFMRGYLARGAFADFADQAELIHATNFAKPLAEILTGLPRQLYVIGQMIGTVDLVSQIASRYYLERCYHYLDREFVTAGADRKIDAEGRTVILYATPEDLLRKTPGFYEHLAKKRIENDFENVAAHVAAHFGGVDPYAQGMQRNLAFLREMIARNDFTAMRRRPLPLMPLDGYELP